MKLTTAMLFGIALSSSTAFAQNVDDDASSLARDNDSTAWRLVNSDRFFMISQQADTMAPMTFRISTIDQLQAVQAMGSGYGARVYADFAPTRWLQVGATLDYGTIGDPAIQNLAAPAVYAKVQLLRQSTAGVNMAAGVNVKKIGFQAIDMNHPNDGEIEGQLFLDKQVGKLAFTANGVFGKSFSAPDSDAELKLSAGYFVRKNVLVGVDSITRYDTSFDGGPKDGTRYWELTGGALVSCKLEKVLVSGLVGVAAPMHAPVGSAGVGPVAMVQLGYLVGR